MVKLRIKNRTASLLIVLAIYILAIFSGLLVIRLTPDMHPLVSMFLADVAATIIVWGFGVFFGNSSVYDPYWSIAPLVILPYWIMIKADSISAVEILFLAAVFIWGIRLTLNWIIRWKGLQHQDWRYSMLKEKSPRLWFFTNLVGINLVPTIVVFTALIPAYYGIGQEKPLNIYTCIWFVFCIGSVLIEYIADRQIGQFKKDSDDKGKHIDRGLWRYSRHPNYLGEISFWWGIWLMQVGVSTQPWATVTGPILLSLLFIFISIPMMEKHVLASAPSYRNYMETVSVLTFMPRKKQS